MPRLLVVGCVVVALAAPLLGSARGQKPEEGVQERVALDNDSVRIALLTFPPGSSSGLHVNTEPEIGIVVEGELTLVTRAGKEVLGPGAVRWLAPMTGHDARNETGRPVKIWALNLKRCE
jgi:quercetin dioxygenase-like cupin family protein